MDPKPSCGAQMRIDDFIDESNRAKTTDEVFSLFQRAASEYGFDRIMYRALRNHPDTVLPCVARSYPDEWIAHYVDRNYVETDPVRHGCLTSSQAFLWDDLAVGLKRDQRLIFDEAAECGLQDGVAVPIHGAAGQCVGVGFASSDGGTEARLLLGKLHLLAVQFHTTYSALSLPAAPALVRLTPREREILSWCAKGKSNWVIGEILHIAEDSVEWHLKNVFRKLEVDSRVTAVVKALHLGLITL